MQAAHKPLPVIQVRQTVTAITNTVTSEGFPSNRKPLENDRTQSQYALHRQLMFAKSSAFGDFNR